ncbi:MAG TPA: glycosyltransferase, partial [Polyangiales bacterium]
MFALVIAKAQTRNQHRLRLVVTSSADSPPGPAGGRMKIAQIAPLVESVPPTLYGGTERVVSWLTEELVTQGHDVTLFASGDSRTSARLVPVVERALRLDDRVRDCLPYNFIMLDQVAELSREFDMLHFHIDFMHYPMFRDIPNRTLTTLHGRLDLPDLQPIYKAFPH